MGFPHECLSSEQKSRSLKDHYGSQSMFSNRFSQGSRFTLNKSRPALPQLGQHASSGIAKEIHSGLGLFQGSPGNSRIVPDKEKKMTVAVSHICRNSFLRVFRILEGSGFSCGL